MKRTPFPLLLLAAALPHFARLHVIDAPGAVPPLPDETGIQAAMFAGGELGAATPLHLAAAYAALFSDGVYHAPTPDGSASGVPALRPETASAVRELLLHTITSPEGTGGLAALPGHRGEGKTGTADLGDGTTYASFVGAVVDVEPRWIVLVGLVAPREGATREDRRGPALRANRGAARGGGLLSQRVSSR